MAVDQQVVEDHVDDVGRQVIQHGGTAVARAAERGGDGTGQRHGDDAQSLDAQVIRAAGQGGRFGGAHKVHQGFGKQKDHNAADDG